MAADAAGDAVVTRAATVAATAVNWSLIKAVFRSPGSARWGVLSTSCGEAGASFNGYSGLTAAR